MNGLMFGLAVIVSVYVLGLFLIGAAILEHRMLQHEERQQ